MKPVTARVHQFADRVAIAFIGAEGETVYLDPQQAIATARALVVCASTVRRDQLRKAANQQRSISTGTMRRVDLIPAFAHELADLTSHEQALNITGFTPDNAPADGDEFWDTADAAYILDSLFDALDSAAPTGCYFGAHPGDGSDYGFWMTEEDADALADLESKTSSKPFSTRTIPPTE